VVCGGPPVPGGFVAAALAAKFQANRAGAVSIIADFEGSYLEFEKIQRLAALRTKWRYL
jgi:hypothetical protein